MSNLPNYTHVKLGVVVDELWVRSEGHTAEKMEEIIRSAFAVADSDKLEHGEFMIEWTNNVTVTEDYGTGIHCHNYYSTYTEICS